MLKFAVLALVVVWIAGFLLGGRRKLIRDSTHLLRLIIWSALFFLVSSFANSIDALANSGFAKLAVLALAAWGAWWLSGVVARNLGKQPPRRR